MPRSKQVLEITALNLAKRREATPAQSRQQQNFAAVGAAWDALAPTSRAAWQQLANQMPHQTGLRTADGLRQTRPMSAYQAFASLNTTRLACGQTISADAPAAPDKPSALPPLMLTATTAASSSETHSPVLGGRGQGVGVLGFTLTLSAPSYEGTIQIYAAPPLLAGQYPALGPNAVIIAVPGGLVSGANDLTDAYAAKFGPLVPGQQVVLTLVPVSPSGFKGVPLNIAADVTASAQSARLQGETPALKAA